MYRQRRRIPITTIIFLGLISGIAFLVYDQTRAPEPTITAVPQNQAVATEVEPVVADENATDTPVFSGALAVTPSPSPVVASDLGPDIENAALVIPSAGIVAPIVRVYVGETSWDVSNLGNNIGHLEGTRWIPEEGNIVLSGHVELADGRQGIFANLNELQVGDRVIITQDGNDYHYDVSTIDAYAPTDLSPVYPSADNRLTLITCGTYDFISDTYLERVVVVAERVAVN